MPRRQNLEPSNNQYHFQNDTVSSRKKKKGYQSPEAPARHPHRTSVEQDPSLTHNKSDASSSAAGTNLDLSYGFVNPTESVAPTNNQRASAATATSAKSATSSKKSNGTSIAGSAASSAASQVTTTVASERGGQQQQTAPGEANENNKNKSIVGGREGDGNGEGEQGQSATSSASSPSSPSQQPADASNSNSAVGPTIGRRRQREGDAGGEVPQNSGDKKKNRQ